MAEKIVFETEVKTGNSATSVKSVKAELRQLKAEMAGLEIGSQQFTNMAQRAGQLEDAIGDANAAVKAFNPEAKFQAFAGVLGGVANGFSVVQGTMALFGSENEEVEKAILKTQAAIAIATGINGLMGMKDAFVILGTVIKTQVVSAFATMRAAIMSTGIIALVAVIGTLIYSWMEEKEANEEATKELERFGEAQRKLLDQEQKIQIARSKGRDKDVLEASAASQANIRAYAKELEDKKITQEEFNKLVKGEQELMRIAINDIDKKYAEEEEKRRKEAAEKEKERLEKKAEREKKAFEKRMEQAQQEYDAYKNNQNKELDALKEYLDEKYKKMDEDDKRRQEIHDKALSYAEDEKNSFKDREETLTYFLKAGYITQKEYADAEAKLDRDKAQKKVEALQMTSAALIGYSQVLGQETEAGKALAAAAALIDTYLAASSVFTNVTQNPYMKLLPDGGLTVAIGAAAAAVVGGLARVKAIYAVKVPGGSGGGSAPSAGGSQSVPQFNPAVAQQVQGGGDVQLGMKPQKVYVVESDIRGTMNKVDVIEANATIG
jgi:hypothetical protein